MLPRIQLSADEQHPPVSPDDEPQRREDNLDYDASSSVTNNNNFPQSSSQQQVSYGTFGSPLLQRGVELAGEPDEDEETDEGTEHANLLERLVGGPNSGRDDNHDVDNTNNNSTTDDDNDEEEEHQDPADRIIVQLTRRLRCLFGVITWPIVPLGTLTVLALLAFLYAALADAGRTCSHPLKAYAVATTVLVLYTPHHRTVRTWLSGAGRNGSDGGVHAALVVRRYDQLFHTAALLYVYAGITLVQSCRQDGMMQLPLSAADHTTTTTTTTTVTGSEQTFAAFSAGAYLNDDSSDPSAAATQTTTTTESPAQEEILLNTCEATCPNLFGALAVYVTTLEVFTCSLLLPLLCLPCIYLWFVRAAAVDDDVLYLLQERLREEEDDDLFGTGGGSGGMGGVSVQEVLQHLQPVRLVRKSAISTTRHVTGSPEDDDDDDDDDDDTTTLLVVPKTATNLHPNNNNNGDANVTIQNAHGVWECCICMNEFVVTDQRDWENEHENGCDVETGTATADVDDDYDEIVQTQACHHLFHRHCIEGWVGGRWQEQPPSPSQQQQQQTANGDEVGQEQTRTSTNGSAAAGGTADNHNNNDSSSTSASPGPPSWMRRRARRSTCPLCRSDLRTIHISS